MKVTIIVISLMLGGCTSLMSMSYSSKEYMYVVKDLCNEEVKSYNPRDGKVICRSKIDD